MSFDTIQSTPDEMSCPGVKTFPPNELRNDTETQYIDADCFLPRWKAVSPSYRFVADEQAEQFAADDLNNSIEGIEGSVKENCPPRTTVQFTASDDTHRAEVEFSIDLKQTNSVELQIALPLRQDLQVAMKISRCSRVPPEQRGKRPYTSLSPKRANPRHRVTKPR